MATNNDITLIPSNDKDTPISEEDLALIRASIEGQQSFNNPSISPPIPSSPMPFAPNESDLSNQNTDTSLSPRETQPIPEPGTTSKVLSGIGLAMAPLTGGLSTMLMTPYKMAQEKRNKAIKSDTKVLGFLDEVRKENPRYAGQLIKSPMFRDAFVRQMSANDDDISNISKILSDPKLSVKEQTSILASNGYVNEQGGIIPRPTGVEKEIEYKKKEFEDFKTAYQGMPKNKDRDRNELDVETYMAYNALDNKKGRTGNRYTLGTSAQNFMIIDQDDPNPDTAFHKIQTGALKKFRYAWVQGEQGTVVGFVMLPESLEPGMDPSDVPVVFKDAAQFLAENGVSPEVIRSISGDRRSYMQKVGDIIRGIDPNFTGFLPETIPGEQVREGNVSAPPSITPGAKPKTKYLGPAKDQRSPAEIEADRIVNGD